MGLEDEKQNNIESTVSAESPALNDNDSITLEGKENPLNWPKSSKWIIIAVMSLMFFVVTTATVACTPASPGIIKSFGTSNHIYSTLLVTVWELGEGLGPLLLAPLSEMYGRRITYNAANIAFVVFAVLTTVSVDLPMLIIMRFLNGFCTATTILNPAVVGDMFVTEERGLAMALVNLTPLLGPVVGPIVGGYIAQDLGWRWVFGIVAIIAGVSAILFLLLFQETYRTVLVRRKARAISNSGHDGVPPPSVGTASFQVKESMLRPIQLLLFSPPVAILTAYVSMAYAFLYIVPTWLPWIFETRYHFSQGSVGLTYLGPGVGICFSVLFCGMTLDRLVERHKNAGRPMLPEHRLPVFGVGSVFMVAGSFLFGWSAQYRQHWIAPIIGSAMLAFGLVTMTIVADTYFVDSFEEHSASAMAALGIVRSLATAGLPLVGPALYNNLGLGWGNSVLGFLLMAGVPVTVILMIYGSQLRAWSRY